MHSTLLRILLSLSFISISVAAEASDELSFVSSMNVPMTRYGMTWQTFNVRLRVKDLAYEKTVSLVVVDSAGKTSVSNASYVGPADAGYEVWEAFANLSGYGPAQFHGELGVSGQTYLADDNGQDFEMKRGPIFFAEQNIQQVLSGKQFYGNFASFSVAVRNLAWQKNVAVQYSCDDFQTKSTAALGFQPYYTYGYGAIQSPTPEGYEMWNTYSVAVPPSCSTIRYYYTYDVEGQHYADTNFGHNYVMYRN